MEVPRFGLGVCANLRHWVKHWQQPLGALLQGRCYGCCPWTAGVLGGIAARKWSDALTGECPTLSRKGKARL